MSSLIVKILTLAYYLRNLLAAPYVGSMARAYLMITAESENDSSDFKPNRLNSISDIETFTVFFVSVSLGSQKYKILINGCIPGFILFPETFLRATMGNIQPMLFLVRILKGYANESAILKRVEVRGCS